MAAVSPVSVLELHDVPPIDLPGGSWSRILIEEATAAGAETTLGYSVFAPGSSTSHMSHDCEELAYVVAGSGLLRLDDGEVRLAADAACHIPAGVWHTVVNNGEDPLAMVFVFASPGYPPTERREARESVDPE